MGKGPAVGALVGRAEELAQLDRFVDAVVAGRGGSVLIEGEPGIGKSAVLGRILDAVDGRCLVLRAVADEFCTPFPLRVLLDSLDPDRQAEITRPMVEFTAIQAGVGDPILIAAERLLALVDRLCVATPVIWALDDLQWADEASISVWGRLCRAAEQLPLLLIAASRQVPERPELSRLRRALGTPASTIVSLGPLSSAQAAELVGELVQAPPGVRLRALIERAGGNPLYLRELVAALRMAELISVRPEGTAEVDDADALWRGPASLSAMIANRLGFLSTETQRVLRMAALLGSEFSVVDLGTVLDTPAVDLVDLLAEAHAAGVLVESGQRTMFRHPLIRQALYNSVPTGLRLALHRQAAEALARVGAPVEGVAQQLVAAEYTQDDWTLDWLAGPGAALDGCAPQAAIELLGRAIRRGLAGDPRQETVESRLATLLRVQARVDELNRVANVVLTRRTTATHHHRMAYASACALAFSEPERANQVIDAALRTPGDGVSSVRLRSLRAVFAATDSGDGDAVTMAQRALADAEANGDRLSVSHALNALAMTTEPRSTASAAEYGRRAVVVLGDDPETQDIWQKVQSDLIMRLAFLGRTAEMDREMNALLENAARMSAVTTARVHVSAALVNFEADRWDDVLAELESVGELPEFGYQSIETHSMWALIAGHRDDRKTAADHLTVLAGTPLGSRLLRNHSGRYFAARALVAEQGQQPSQALEALKPLLAPEMDTGPRGRWRWLPELVRLAAQVGDTDTAEAAARLAVSDADRERLPELVATAECCRGLLDDDPVSLRRAADRFCDRGRTLEQGLALENSAVLFARSGDMRRGRAAFVDAIEIYLSLGAVWDVTRAEVRVRPLGIRRGRHGPRRRPASGWAALTPTERRVVSLVAEGRSNPDVAAELFLSRRTVQTHVSHILAKLGMHSRVEVARAAVERLAGQGETR